MKICPLPSCGKEHSRPGKFCCRSCANTRTFSEESIQKKIDGVKKWYNSLSDEDRELLKKKQHSAEIKEKRKQSIDAKFSSMQWGDLSAAGRKKRIIKEQDGRCLICRINEWLDSPVILELDHIDGNTDNNNRVNLRALCPNCHSQTPTWRKGFKNRPPDEHTIMIEYHNSTSMTDLLKRLNLKWGSFVLVTKILEKNGIGDLWSKKN